MKKLLLIPTVALLAAPLGALAESNVIQSAPANAKATANLDFKITVPRVLYLQVGVGTPATLANNTGIDLIDLVVPAGSVGNGSPVAATAASGDQANGAVTVRLLANGNSTVQLNSTTLGAMTNANGQTIGWDQISVATAALAATTTNFSNGSITHPAFNTGTGGGLGSPTTLNAPASGLIRQEGKWTFSYANANVVAAGTYGGVNTQNGRVSYTATMP